jgi:aspartate 1-decarboxylase
MQLNLLKAKIHRATVTHAELHYEGSCATYAIRGEEGSGVISVNGAAAHCASPGDLVIICAYAAMDEAEAAKYKPTCVYVDRQNALTHTNHSMPKQAA